MTSVEVRAGLVRALELDLVGPAEGLGVMFCQLFARFSVKPCDFYHSKNRLSNSNARGLKGFS